jgi:hypothetical protein
VPEHVAQHPGGAQLERHPGERAIDERELGALLLRGVGGGLLLEAGLELVRGPQAHPPAEAEPPVGSAHRHAREPAAHRPRGLELRELLERDEERLLDDVVDLAGIAQQALRDAGDQPYVAPVERLVRPLVAPPRARHELLVGEALLGGRDERHHLRQGGGGGARGCSHGR